MPSVDTKLPFAARPLHKTTHKSVIIRVCENKRCMARFEVTETFQSQKMCPTCRVPKQCVHKINTTERCDCCRKTHGNFFIRTM